LLLELVEGVQGEVMTVCPVVVVLEMISSLVLAPVQIMDQATMEHMVAHQEKADLYRRKRICIAGLAVGEEVQVQKEVKEVVDRAGVAEAVLEGDTSLL
jgi:hypothetical protein